MQPLVYKTRDFIHYTTAVLIKYKLSQKLVLISELVMSYFAAQAQSPWKTDQMLHPPEYCKFGNICENFISANSDKRHNWDVKKSL